MNIMEPIAVRQLPDGRTCEVRMLITGTARLYVYKPMRPGDNYPDVDAEY